MSPLRLPALLHDLRLRARLQHCDRLLEGIARQRANDLEAERLLHREAALLRVRIGALPDRR
jgi:hypothetical protein